MMLTCWRHKLAMEVVSRGSTLLMSVAFDQSIRRINTPQTMMFTSQLCMFIQSRIFGARRWRTLSTVPPAW